MAVTVLRSSPETSAIWRSDAPVRWATRIMSSRMRASLSARSALRPTTASAAPISPPTPARCLSIAATAAGDLGIGVAHGSSRSARASLSGWPSAAAPGRTVRPGLSVVQVRQGHPEQLEDLDPFEADARHRSHRSQRRSRPDREEPRRRPGGPGPPPGGAGWWSPTGARRPARRGRPGAGRQRGRPPPGRPAGAARRGPGGRPARSTGRRRRPARRRAGPRPARPGQPALAQGEGGVGAPQTPGPRRRTRPARRRRRPGDGGAGRVGGVRRRRRRGRARSASTGVASAAGERSKPFTTSQTPSENSQRATGAVAIPATVEPGPRRRTWWRSTRRSAAELR